MSSDGTNFGVMMIEEADEVVDTGEDGREEVEPDGPKTPSDAAGWGTFPFNNDGSIIPLNDRMYP